METIREKIAYLRGVLDGESALKEDRIRFMFERTFQVLQELAREVDSLKQGQEELEDYLQEVDFDLAFLEEEFFLEEDEEGFEFPFETDSCCVEMECPSCDELVIFDEDFLADEGVQIRCPNCDAIVFETEDFQELTDFFEEE